MDKINNASYAIGNNTHIEKYLGEILPGQDPRNMGRYWVYVPNVLQYSSKGDGPTHGVLCRNRVHNWRFTQGVLDNSSSVTGPSAGGGSSGVSGASGASGPSGVTGPSGGDEEGGATGPSGASGASGASQASGASEPESTVSTTYGEYHPLHPKTQVMVEFYNKDYNTGYIVEIISDDKAPAQPFTNIDQEIPSADRDHLILIFKNISKSRMDIYEKMGANVKKVQLGREVIMPGQDGIALDDRNFTNHMEFSNVGIDLYAKARNGSLGDIFLYADRQITLKAKRILLDAPIVCITGSLYVAGAVVANSFSAGAIPCPNIEGEDPEDPEKKEKDFEDRMKDWLDKITAPTGGGRGACWTSDGNTSALHTHHATGPQDVVTYLFCDGATTVTQDEGCTGQGGTTYTRPSNFVCPI